MPLYGEIQTKTGMQRMRLEMKGDMFVRDSANFKHDTYAVLNEFKSTYRRMIALSAGHSFLDIGAHIGVFTVNAMLAGAQRGICYEPERGALSVLRANVARFGKKVKVVPEAVGGVDKQVMLSVPYLGNSVHFNYQRRVMQPVRQRAFQDVLEAHKVSLLKVDCEGAELEFLNGKKLPKHIEIVCGELHRWDDNEDRCRKIIDSFGKWRQIHKTFQSCLQQMLGCCLE
ncbi:MAG TPA: FkbM family methyltransferase [Anaerolineae bacterium]|nr:FkbM family methyltransferase [Anaerolineae bacterium]